MGQILIIKVKEKGSNTGFEYKNKINLQDPSLISSVLEDLEKIFNAPIKKACRMILDKDKVFPFSP